MKKFQVVRAGAMHKGILYPLFAAALFGSRTPIAKARPGCAAHPGRDALPWQWSGLAMIPTFIIAINIDPARWTELPGSH